MDFKKYIEDIKDFPEEGIILRDVTPTSSIWGRISMVQISFRLSGQRSFLPEFPT